MTQPPSSRVQRTRGLLGGIELPLGLVSCLVFAACRQEAPGLPPPAAAGARVEGDKILQTVTGHWSTGQGPGDSGYSYFTPCGTQEKLWLKVPCESGAS